MVKKISKKSSDAAVKALEDRLGQLDQELEKLDEEIGPDRLKCREALQRQIYEIRSSIDEIRMAHAPREPAACSV